VRGYLWRVRGAADGVFTLEEIGPGPEGWIPTGGLLSGDVTGDGVVDVLGIETAGPTTVLWAGDASGGFSAGAPEPFPGHWRTADRATLADVDGDGDADFITQGYGTPEHGGTAGMLWLAGGSGGLDVTPQVLLPGPAYLRDQVTGVSLVDLDLDGDDELLVGAPGAGDDVVNQGWVLRWDGPVDRTVPEPSAVWQWNGDGLVWAEGGEDIDADGFSDLVVTTRPHFESGRSVFRGSPDGLQTVPQQTALPAIEDTTRWSPAGDIDGDGRGDWIGVHQNHTSWWSGAADAPVEWHSNAVYWFATADVDGDGYDDLTDGWGIYRGGPGGPDDRSTWLLPRGGPAVRFKLDDDAFDDLVVQSFDATSEVFYAFRGSPSGPVPAWAWRPDPTPPELVQQLDPHGIHWSDLPTSLVNVGDVDGDGAEDLVYADPNWTDGLSAVDVAKAVPSPSGRLLWLRGGPGAPQTGWSFGFHRRTGRLLGVERIGDLNGDGYADVLVRFSGRWQGGTTFAVWYGSPAGPDRVTVGPCDTAGADVVRGVGDVNGDGYDDLAVSWRSFGLRGAVWVFHGGPDGVGVAIEAAPADAGGGHALAEAVTRPLSPPPSSTPAPEAPCGCATTRPAPLPLAALLLCARARRRR